MGGGCRGGGQQGERHTENGIAIIFSAVTKRPVWVGTCTTEAMMTVSRPTLSGPGAPCRETPLHQLYSAPFNKQKLQDAPTKKPALPFGDLPPGFQHLHTQLQYECISPFYRRLGSSRRTCLRTGKWSGRAPSCVPSESGVRPGRGGD